MSTGELFMKTGSTIHQMDTTTGKILSTVYLSATTNNMLAFNAINEGYTGVRSPGIFRLQKINPYKGEVVSVGSNFIGSISAIAFGKPLPATTWYLDADGDQYAISTVLSSTNPGIGYTKTVLPVTDCNDADATINPLTVWYLDADGDKYAVSTMQSCTSPGAGYTRTVLPLTDCNDADAAINPLTVWYLDADGDKFATSTTQSCTSPGAGYTRTVLPLTDCNDADATLNPLTVWYLDADGDNYAISTIQSCTSPGAGYTRTVLPVTDCNDADATLNPLTVWYFDADGDKYAVSTTQSCTSPGTSYTRIVLPVTDCDDTKILYADVDGDGFGYGAPAACGVSNNTDNCPFIGNITQNDFDKDGIGDACDSSLDICKAIEVLTSNVNTYVDKNKDEEKLIDKLEKALKDVLNGKINSAINDIEAFINKVESKIGKNNGLTEAEAAELIYQANLILIALKNGTYTISCIAPGQITNDFVLSQPGLFESNPDIKIQVSPNPNKGNFVLHLKNVKALKAEVLIMDAKGSMMEMKRVQLSGNEQTVQVNLNNPQEGIYLVRVISNGRVTTTKVLVQK